MDPRGLDELFDGGGVLHVPEVVSPATAAAFVATVEARAPERYAFSTAFEAYSVGRILDQERDLSAYFAAARRYEATLTECGGSHLPVVAFDAMRGLGSGTTLVVPTHPDHGRYTSSTLRCLPTGGIIPPHCETEQLEGPQYAHLRSLIEDREVLSWFLALQAADAGGELCRYEVARDSDRGRAIYADRDTAGALLADAPHELVRAAPGDLVVFAGGRRFHEVRPVRGPTSRWTLGGFACRAKAGGYFAFS